MSSCKTIENDRVNENRERKRDKSKRIEKKRIDDDVPSTSMLLIVKEKKKKKMLKSTSQLQINSN